MKIKNTILFSLIATFFLIFLVSILTTELVRLSIKSGRSEPLKEEVKGKTVKNTVKVKKILKSLLIVNKIYTIQRILSS